MNRIFKVITLTLLLALPLSLLADDYTTKRPRLLLSADGVEKIKASQGTIPAFDASIAEVKENADNALSMNIDVPMPLDAGGGYSHEQHKQNYYNMYHCGIMYQLSGEAKYAEYIKEMLFEYAKMYTSLPLHPDMKSKTRGRLFWQTLNEFVWLVHTSSAYDCVYEYLSPEDREVIETNVFRPMAEFFIDGNAANNNTFNLMHNHGTWVTAAVGMIGYVLGDKDLVDKALYGSDKKGNNTGFVSQLDVLFSPDGYFTEGAYYQRYAIWPFVVFAQVIDHNQPELGIYNYRDGILKKATRTVVDLTYNRYLFSFNDALEKSLDAQEIVNAINASYKSDPSDKQLLSIAASQNKFVVSDAGLFTASAVEAGEAEPFIFKSRLLTDGADGSEGGIAIIRASEQDANGMTLVFKATSHGLSHGHYDKLGFALYDNGAEIIPDYGAARFLNLEPKNGGQYTAENSSFARQTIAHNTVAVDKASHFGGNMKLSSQFAPRINFYGEGDEGDKAGVQIVSAYTADAAEGVAMNRTMAVIETGAEPLVIDIFRVVSDKEHTYDLPFYYKGQLVETNFKLNKNTTSMFPFGDKAGYQHLWQEAQGAMSVEELGPVANFTWVVGNRFYSVNTLADDQTEFFQVRTGANDPDQNLRSEPAIVIRENKASHTFVSTIEPHGIYDLVMEVTAGYKSNVSLLETLVDNEEYTIVSVTMTSGKQYTLCVQNQGSELAKDANNVVKTDNGQEYSWTGDYALFTKYATK